MNSKILRVAGRGKAMLSAEQSAILESWLFEASTPLTYREAMERLARELGVRLSMGAITGFFQRRARERMLAQAAASGKAGNPAWGSLDRAEAHRVLMEVAGRLGFDLAVNGEKLTLRELTRLTKLAAADRAAKRVRLMERETEIKGELLALKKRLMALRERAEARRTTRDLKRGLKEEAGPEEKRGAANFDLEARPAMAA